MNFFLTFIFKRRSHSQASFINQIIKATSDKGNLALVSTSKNIHYNLALENYIAENTNLKHRSILLLWTNDPCIVFGRHQNPWLECDVKQCELSSVKLARRFSGGGCVYHDHGNLNISFIVDRSKYDRGSNLNLIKTALESLQYKDEVQFEISPRHDIYLKRLKSDQNHESFKISGTASRLAQKFSYHHCTLLLDAKLTNMSLLKSCLAENIVTKATPSVRSKCLNLRDLLDDSNMNVDGLIERICQSYWRLNNGDWSIEHLFAYVNPEEASIVESLEANLCELKSWEYIFGTTPKFQLCIPLAEKKSELRFNIVKGAIKDYEIVNEEHLNDLGTLKSGLNTMLNCKLDTFDLAKCLTLNSDLFSLNRNFEIIFNFLNKKVLI